VVWPFPGTLDGNEGQDSLAAEAQQWESLGRLLSWLPYDGFIGPRVSTRDSASEYESAIDAWSTCVESGLALRYLAGVLRACFHPLAEKVCDKCYRHVGPNQRRRCALHQARSSQRGQALRLDEISNRYLDQLATLRRTLSQDPVYCDPAAALSKCWQPGHQDAYVGRRNPVQDGRWPTQPPREAAARLADGLSCMVERLAAVIGPVLHERMVKLADRIEADVFRVISEWESREQSSQPAEGHCKPRSIDDALKTLTPPGFFELWCSGISSPDATATDYAGNDPDHPLVRLPVEPKRQVNRSKQSASLSPTSPGFSLSDMVHHLVRHRAWVDVGGEDADRAIRSGQPVRSVKTRRRIDVDQARCLLNAGMSYRKIAEIFGVSGPAIFKSLKP
jgi:hypothetical protein